MKVSVAQGQMMPQLRPDYRQGLERRIDGFLGPRGSQSRAVLEKSFGEYLKDGKFDLKALPADAQRELMKLQKASEQFEAHFIKDLMSQMRKVKFSEDKSSEMTDFAYDQMDQAVADAASTGNGSVGIGKSIFESMGDLVVKRAVGQQIMSQTPKSTSKSE